ncbi:Uncharacterized protein QTN25_000312 [Entamoeba marina]
MNTPNKSWKKPTQIVPSQKDSSHNISSNSSLSPPPHYSSPYFSPYSSSLPFFPHFNSFSMGGFGDNISQLFYTYGFASEFVSKAWGVIHQLIHDLNLDEIVVSIWKKVENIPLVVPFKRVFWKIFVWLCGEKANDKSGYLFMIGLFLTIPYLYRKIYQNKIK